MLYFLETYFYFLLVHLSFINLLPYILEDNLSRGPSSAILRRNSKSEVFQSFETGLTANMLG